MKFATLGTLALTLTALWGADAQAFGRKNRAKACCPTNTCHSSHGHGSLYGSATGGCGATHAYASGQHMTTGYAVAQPTPMSGTTTAPTDTTPGATAGQTSPSGPVTVAGGTTANTQGGIVQASGTTTTAVPGTFGPAPTGMPVTYSTGISGDATGTMYDSSPSRRRGLFGFRR